MKKGKFAIGAGLRLDTPGGGEVKKRNPVREVNPKGKMMNPFAKRSILRIRSFLVAAPRIKGEKL